MELERKLRQQHQSDAEVAVLKQTVWNFTVNLSVIISGELGIKDSLRLVSLFFLVSDQRAGAQVEGTRTPAISCRIEGNF